MGFAALLSTQSLFAQTTRAPEHAGVRDFMQYWAASRLLVRGGNPYSPDELFSLQQAAGWRDSIPLVMWNPPWTFIVTLPFSGFSYPTGQFLWLLFHVLLLLFAAQRLWEVYGDSTRPSRLPWLLAVAYVPTVFVLIIQQITPLILAGLAAFLCLERRRKMFAAGASLVLLSLKPHLLYLFWIVLLLWLAKARLWRLGLGIATAGLSAAALPLLFDPQVYTHYLALYKIADIPGPVDWLTPTLRTATKLFLGPGHVWLELAPSLLAMAWAVNHWRRHKDRWRWSEQLPLLIMASVASSFFSWTYDHIVFLPAIIEAASGIKRKSIPWHNFWTARAYIAINACHALLRVWVADEKWYFWLAPALLVNYLIFRWEIGKIGSDERPSISADG